MVVAKRQGREKPRKREQKKVQGPELVRYSISLRIFQFVVIHTVKGFGIVNKAEVDVFLDSCFFDDPTDVANLI